MRGGTVSIWSIIVHLWVEESTPTFLKFFLEACLKEA